MIGISKFWNAKNDRAVTGTSGYDDTFIEMVNQVQMQAITTLAPYYETNQAIKDILSRFVKEDIKETDVSNEGLLLKENDYIRFIAVLSAAGKPAYPINSNEVAIIKTSPIRKPSVEKGTIFYHQKDNQFYFLPDDVSIPVTYTYLRKPADAALTLTPAETDELDYLIPSAPTDLEWPEEAFNLLLYMTLEKLGMEMKEPILIEYANLGLSKEMINIQPK